MAEGRSRAGWRLTLSLLVLGSCSFDSAGVAWRPDARVVPVPDGSTGGAVRDAAYDSQSEASSGGAGGAPGDASHWDSGSAGAAGGFVDSGTLESGGDVSCGQTGATCASQDECCDGFFCELWGGEYFNQCLACLGKGAPCLESAGCCSGECLPSEHCR